MRGLSFGVAVSRWRLMSRNCLSVSSVLLVTLFLATASANEKQKPAIDWQRGPATADLGGIAEINVPKGFLFTDKKGAQKLLELTQNIPSGTEVGAVIPELNGNEKGWFVIYEFHELGFVRDDEKGNLDAGALLKSIQDATEEENQTRKERGWGAFHILAWEREPFYDQVTHNLTWAIRGHDENGSDSVNHSIRILGRHGTMNVDLVLDPEQYADVVPRFNTLMNSFQFRQGSRYADFVKGDKVAAYGLTALIAGGAGAIAVKTGLLMKFWKLIVVVVLALKKALIAIFVAFAAGIKKLWNKIRGRSEMSDDQQPEPSEPPVGTQTNEEETSAASVESKE